MDDVLGWRSQEDNPFIRKVTMDGSVLEEMSHNFSCRSKSVLMDTVCGQVNMCTESLEYNPQIGQRSDFRCLRRAMTIPVAKSSHSNLDINLNMPNCDLLRALPKHSQAMVLSNQVGSHSKILDKYTRSLLWQMWWYKEC